MKISTRKKIGLIVSVMVLLAVGVWDLSADRSSYGIGMIIGALGIGFLAMRNIRKLEDMENKGIDVYDERVMQVAGLAAQGTIKLLALGLALFVGLGAIMGPIVKVNPYNFAGYLLTIIMLLYVGLYSFHNRRL